MTEAKLKLTKARIAMIMKQPFFGTLALRLKLVERDTLNPPTMAVDGKHIFYHPKWVAEHDHDVVMSAIAHEVGHCVFEHIGRRGGRDAKRWNHAGDYVINLVLKDSGFTVPSNWLCNTAYAGMSTDQIYQMLPPDLDDGPGAFDEIHDAPQDGEITDEWKIAAVQAANAQREHGTLPDSLKRFVDDIVKGRADWRAVMRRFMTDSTRDDYSYQRVNRKFASLGIFLPGLYCEAMGEVVAVIDTSGSITKEVLAEFGGEISELRNQIRPSLTRVMYCDARVNHVDEFEPYDDFHVDAHGGGGTDFRPPFRWIDERGIEPKCFVYLTDGYGDFPKEAPNFPVLWLMTTDVVPPWGEVVRIEV